MTGRTMIFVDGENLVMRFQEMIKPTENGTIHARPNIFHIEDICVWPYFNHGIDEVIRAYYYTSAPGNEEHRDALCDRMKACELYGKGSEIENLYPVIFSKPSRTRKAKAVDIRMTVDILTHVYQDNIDTVYLITGDGDFLPVIEAAIRAGKRVYVAALSSGLSPALKRIADGFISLDHVFFETPEETRSRNIAERGWRSASE